MRDYTIRTKFVSLIIVILIITTISGVISIYDLKKVDQGVITMYENRVIPLKQLKEIADVYAVDIVNLTHKAYHGSISWEEVLSHLKDATKVVQENWDAYESDHIVGTERKLLLEAIELRKASKGTYYKIVNVIEKGKSEETLLELKDIIRNELYQTIDPYSSKISELIDLQLYMAEVIKKDSDAILSSTIMQVIIFISVALLVAVVIAYFFIRGINRQLGGEPYEVEAIANKISNGDFDIDVEEESVGVMKSMKSMAEKLHAVITDVQVGADQISTASLQLNSSSQQLSQGANEQASSVEEISTTMEEMVANISSNAENSRMTATISEGAKEGIDHVSERTQLSIKANQHIAAKTSMISEIAMQTNILALNAAVEAARSGKQGKGFAVVAAEVRKLAEKSKEAAEEIVGLVSGGLETATIAGDMMVSILPEVQKTTDLVKEISVASEEQNSGVAQVNNALQQLNSITQQNAASSEELAASSEEMSAQAERLKELISFFNIKR